jgi:hypothetical protein
MDYHEELALIKTFNAYYNDCQGFCKGEALKFLA